MIHRLGRIVVLAAFWSPVPARADNLYAPGRFPALASDRIARSAGDIITIVIYENASATNDANSSSKKSTKLSGSLQGGSIDERGGIGIDGGSGNQGATGRSGHMVAQISAIVEEVLPNGDLRVAGEQNLNVNGEKTHIRIKGRLRQADISPSNAVLSSRLAEAAIDYDGTGFVTRSAKPGVISKIFNWLGLL